MHRQDRQRLRELNRKITIAGRVHAVGRGRRKIQFPGHQFTIQDQRRAGNSARAERAEIEPPAAVAQPAGIAQKHLAIGQQPVRHQHRLGTLQMGVGRHGRHARLFCAPCNRLHQLQQQAGDLVARGAHEQTQVGCDLLVAAASCVQFECGLPDDALQVLFHEVVNVLGLLVVSEAPARMRTKSPARGA